MYRPTDIVNSFNINKMETSDEILKRKREQLKKQREKEFAKTIRISPDEEEFLERLKG